MAVPHVYHRIDPEKSLALSEDFEIRQAHHFGNVVQAFQALGDGLHALEGLPVRLLAGPD